MSAFRMSGSTKMFVRGPTKKNELCLEIEKSDVGN